MPPATSLVILPIDFISHLLICLITLVVTAMIWFRCTGTVTPCASFIPSHTDTITSSCINQCSSLHTNVENTSLLASNLKYHSQPNAGEQLSNM